MTFTLLSDREIKKLCTGDRPMLSPFVPELVRVINLQTSLDSPDIRAISYAEPLEQIAVRMDDKLSRIKSAQYDDLEDAKLDLLGYLVLEAIAKL